MKILPVSPVIILFVLIVNGSLQAASILDNYSDIGLMLTDSVLYDSLANSPYTHSVISSEELKRLKVGSISASNRRNQMGQFTDFDR